MSDAYLKALNAAQLRAVTHDPHIPLQILAGPGSGKTRVLTCRVAHLVEAHKFRPQNICAVTFTNKAANEMRERLKKLIGPERTTGLVMGTFHALCAKYLRVYGTSIGLPSNFSICDAEESKKIITAILKRPEILEDMQACSVKIEPNFAASAISRAKAKGIAASNYERASKKPSAPPRPPQGETAQERSDTERIIGEIYKLYSAELLASNSLDFDDLLVFGVKLLRAHPAAVANLQHVLVDEFQDTNIMQFELMCLLASAKRCVSIVGDPDQSIYGWRSAEVENLAKMKREFTGTQQILLEENYRSSGAILDASLAIISRDDKRVAKSLFTSHPKGPTPTLFECYDEWREANAVVQEIRRLMAFGCGKLAYNDFAILLRFNALSLHLESALRKAGIPCRIMGGHQFFDRAEVKDLIAYLQLVDNADFKPAFVRACNTPKRGLGKKSIDELLAQAERSKKSPMALAEAIVHGRAPDVKPPARLKLAPFVRAIELLRAKSLASTSAVELIQSLVSLINYEEYLKQNEDWESRWENVKQLMTFATELSGSDSSNVLGGEVGVSELGPREDEETQLPQSELDDETQDVIDLTLDEEVDANLGQPSQAAGAVDGPREGGPLRQFLEGCMLSTDTQTSEDQANQPKVTISTCHAAKGLEWPVVFVPAVEQEVFPFYRSEDHAEERRLLYVACTRAQGFLYISYARERAVGGNKVARGLSNFVREARGVKPNILTVNTPDLSYDSMLSFWKLIEREPPSEKDVSAAAADFAISFNDYSANSSVEALGVGIGPSRISHSFGLGTPESAAKASASSDSSMAFQPYLRSGGFGVTRPMSTMAGVQSSGALVNRISSAVGAFVGNSVGSIPGRFPGSGNTVVAPLPSVQIVAPGRASGSGLRNVKLESTPPAAAMMATKPRSGSSLPSTQTQPKLGFRSASTPSSAPTSNPASTRGTRLHYIKTESSTSSETIDLSIESDDDEPVIVQVVRGPSSGQSARQPPKNAASSGNSAGASVPKPAIAPPKPVAGQKRLGMRGPLKPFGAPKEKRVRTE